MITSLWVASSLSALCSSCHSYPVGGQLRGERALYGNVYRRFLPLSPSSLPSFFFFVNFSPASYYPNAWNRLVYQPVHYFTPLHLYVSLKLIIYIMVLYWTGSHSSVRFLGCGTTVLLPNKSSNREVQPLAALYPTARLSPCRQVRKNIHSRV